MQSLFVEGVLEMTITKKNNILVTTQLAVLSKFPTLGATMSTIKFAERDIATACTDGKTIYYNQDFLENLSFNERVFLLSHEILHIAFGHLARKEGKDNFTWNLATDAVINQILKNENLPLLEGAVDMPDALGKSADEIYDKLINEQGNKKGKNDLAQSQHSQWNNYKIVSNEPINVKNKGKNQKSNENLPNFPPNIEEKTFLKENSQAKEDLAKNFQKNIFHKISKTNMSKLFLDDIGQTKQKINWKKQLKSELKEKDVWLYNRACEENDFQPVVGEFQNDDKYITEVLLDTSGSINESMLKEFLRQLKDLVKDSKLMVGCFDTKFYGFKEVKSSNDIDNFQIIGRGGTDFNLALDSFSKNRECNKVIFTDGKSEVNSNAKNRKMDVIWVLMNNNKAFKPCCGKVILTNICNDNDKSFEF